MSAAVDEVLAAALDGGQCFIGELAVRRAAEGFILVHRSDEANRTLQEFRSAEDAREIARFDDAGNYRPLKTAPNLRHGWRLEVVDLPAVRRAIEYFYPGRLAVLQRWKNGELRTTALRQTLARQSGIYRVAAKISDQEIDRVVGNFCRSDGGCLRTILWTRDQGGRQASARLPPQKYDPAADQTGGKAACVPLLCQEACNLLVNECRKAVKAAGPIELGRE